MLGKPWVSGPRELLSHAVGHLKAGGPFDYRIAFISIDNAVELAVKTYLGLPEPARGSSGPTRKELQAASVSFPDLVDLLEKHAGQAVQGIDLGDIEWYHRLRNTLYHDGNGVTVAPVNVDGYLQVAKLLFQGLFKCEIGDEVLAASPITNLGEFIVRWGELERRVRELAAQCLPKKKTLATDLVHVVDGLVSKGVVNGPFRSRLAKVGRARNEIVHGIAQPEESRLKEVLDLLAELLDELPPEAFEHSGNTSPQ